MKKFPSLYILMTYALTLGFVAVLNGMYPVEVASIIQRVTSSRVDLSASDYARYRIALFLSATALLVVLFPFMWRLGAKLAVQNPLQFPTWKHFFTAVILVPIIWMGYPFIGLCATCWTSNDFFYYLLTVLIFFGLQIMIEVIVLKLTHRNGK
jgi:hypothetical protein